MFLVIIIVAVVLCVAVIYLPYAAGLTTVKKQAGHKLELTPKREHKENSSGYLPPDEELRLQQADATATTSSLKDKMKVTAENLPIQIKLNQDSVLRKRSERKIGDFNPNNYDYDLDELIREETEGEAQRESQRYYSQEKIGGEKEDMV